MKQHQPPTEHTMLASRLVKTVCLVLLGVLCLPARPAAGQGLRTGSIYPVRGNDGVAAFTLRISVSRGSPACGPVRPVILVNGLFQPTLYANVNDTIKITIQNRIPATFPRTSSGISIHFHGMSMWDEAAWADGTSFVTQCPIGTGTTYTYSFLADESPGTYFWHDHSTVNRANGLQGSLILGLPRDGSVVQPDPPYADHLLFINDWFNTEANYLAMQLNRPTDPAKATNDTGMAIHIPQADALLINGKGNQNDCPVNSTTTDGLRITPVCSVSAVTQPSTGNGSFGCTHETFLVEPKKTYLFRLVNAGTQQYVSVCFENHTVVLVGGDNTPMDNVYLPTSCVDLDSGQRYDVLITTDQPSGVYWISVHHQYTLSAAPSAYALLRYTTATSTNDTLPVSPTPQAADVQPWTSSTQSMIVTSDFVLGYNDNYDFEKYWMLFNHRGSYTDRILQYGSQPDKLIVFNMTSPLMVNGVAKWAMNNVAHTSDPPCACLMDRMVNDTNFLYTHAAPNDTQAQQNITAKTLAVSVFNRSNTHAYVFDTTKESPVYPVAGVHVVPLPFKAVVDIVINNLPNTAMNGEYRPNDTSRSFSMPHPIHMHGHKFWILGQGEGVYDPATDFPTLNWRNPMLRDTVTLPRASWIYLRFRANNPGLWPLHCHIMWHAFMGQLVVLAEAVPEIKPRPEPGPPCPAQCLSNFAPYSKPWLRRTYRNSRYKVPDE